MKKNPINSICESLTLNESIMTINDSEFKVLLKLSFEDKKFQEFLNKKFTNDQLLRMTGEEILREWIKFHK